MSGGLKDPIERFKGVSLEEGLITEEEVSRIDEEVAAQIEEAVRFAEESPAPEIGSIHENLYA